MPPRRRCCKRCGGVMPIWPPGCCGSTARRSRRGCRIRCGPWPRPERWSRRVSRTRRARNSGSASRLAKFVGPALNLLDSIQTYSCLGHCITRGISLRRQATIFRLRGAVRLGGASWDAPASPEAWRLPHTFRNLPNLPSLPATQSCWLMPRHERARGILPDHGIFRNSSRSTGLNPPQQDDVWGRPKKLRHVHY